VYAAGNARSRLELEAAEAGRRSIDAGTLGAVSSPLISTHTASSHSTAVSSAFPTSGALSVSGQQTQARRCGRSVDQLIANSAASADIESGQKSTTPGARWNANPMMATSTSLSYYYYGAAVMGKSTNSVSSTRARRLQRSLTEPEQACAMDELTSPEVVSGTGVDAATATTQNEFARSAKNDGLELARSSSNAGGDEAAVNGLQTANYADRSRIEAVFEQQRQQTSDVTAAGHVAELNSASSRRHSDNGRCADAGRQTDGSAPLPPSSEFADTSGRFKTTRQMAAPETIVTGFGTEQRTESLLGFGHGHAMMTTHCRDPVQSLHPAYRRSNETAVDIAAILESPDVCPDDACLPELASPTYYDNVHAGLGNVAVAAEEPETESFLVDGTPETRTQVVGEVAAVVAKIGRDDGARRLSQDSFNRPDSPMFHRLIELPRDSVILRNRRRRLRRYSNCSSSSTSSSSSSSSSCLSDSRHSGASGAVRFRAIAYSGLCSSLFRPR